MGNEGEGRGILKEDFMVVIFSIMVLIVAILSWVWANGIDYMNENHPDYKADDFLEDNNQNDIVE